MFKTVAGLLDDAIKRHRKQVFCIERKRFRRKLWTYADIDEHADRIAGLLQSKGVKKGDRVGICAPNGPWWIIVYLACLKLGIVVVPIDVNSSEEFIIKVAHKTHLKLLFKTVYKPLESVKLETVELEQLSEILYEETLLTPTYPKISADDVLEIVFTSGSTGDPKGVVLTQQNVASNVQSLRKAWPIGRNHRLLSMIPLSHMFEQTAGFLVPFVSGSTVVYVESVRPYQVVKALQAEQITTIVTVPAFLSLLRRRIMEKAEASHIKPLLEREFKFARLWPRSARRYMFQGLYVQLGESLKLMAVGGAALPADLEAFWETLGIRVVQGYGLTETAPIATYNSPKAHKRGSVGRCLPGQGLRLAQDGEILLAGNNVFKEYFENPTETTKVLHDGWFHTGDVGRIDKHGFLFITGRKKNMLLSESGLNIYPEDIEAQLANFPTIRDSVVLFTEVNGKEQLTAVVLTDSSEVEVAALVQKANQRLASHQTIQHTIIWPETDFPRTPTRKVKRQLIIDSVQGNHTQVNQIAGPAQGGFTPLQQLVADVAGVPPDSIHDGTNLVSDLGLDSLKRLELVSKIEEEIGAFLEESSINTSTSFADLTAMVAKATRSPKPKLFTFSPFESTEFGGVRALLQLPLLGWGALFQKLQGDKLHAPEEPVIYIANHTSHFDTITMLRLLPIGRRRRVLVAAAKDYFFKNRVQAFLLRLILPLIPLDREGGIQESLEQIGGYLDRGQSIVLFPEGTRSTTGKLLPFKRGIGVIAQELEVPIVPLRFIGNDTILPKGKSWPRRGTTDVRVGKPLVFGKDGDYAGTTTELEEVVRNL